MDLQQQMASEWQRAAKLFGSRHQPGFADKISFADWFVKQFAQQQGCCYYCETSISDILLLIGRNRLKARKTGYGFRGPVLEVDKRNNHEGYRPENCVLSCYYCNNDKSYTLNSETYKLFFGQNRKAYFAHLLEDR